MTKYSSYDIEKKYSKLSTDELKNILNNNSEEYRPTVINIIIEILKNRGENIDISKVQYGNESTIKYDLVQSGNNSKTVLILGVLFLIISIVLSILAVALEQSYMSMLNVFVKVIISIISMKTAYDFTKIIKRKKYLWGFLGFIFGGLTLIIISFLKKKKELNEDERNVLRKKTFRVSLFFTTAIAILITSFILINDFLDKKRAADSYQEYIDRRINYVENPENGYLFYFTSEDYYQNIKAKAIEHNKDSILFKSPRYLGKKYKELYRTNGYDLEDHYYIVIWVAKEKLKSSIESSPSDSGNFEGIPLEELSGSKMKYRFDRLEN